MESTHILNLTEVIYFLCLQEIDIEHDFDLVSVVTISIEWSRGWANFKVVQLQVPNICTQTSHP